jgi:Ser/Thr protein kinase RdoA (MazF antagonist)
LYLQKTLDGVITPYNSYVNRVYGVKDEDDIPYIIKFYSPKRWTAEGILEEHRFIRQCEEEEIPVVAPLASTDGSTLCTAEGLLYTVFPLRGGRTFDITSDEDWVRLGAIIGRMHRVGKREDACHRTLCSPRETTAAQAEELLASGLIPPDLATDFSRLCSDTIELIEPLFRDIDHIRIHGDCHRGNILDRLAEGLLIIDFDDMMTGPAVQDLWLLLPGHFSECTVETDLLLYGYTQFMGFDTSELILVEPLRFMRIIYFLSWCASQKDDPGFFTHFPAWGEEGFWIKEIEDIAYQQQIIREHLHG